VDSTRYAGASPVRVIDEIAIGGRLVVYQYCISLGIVTFKRSSGVKLVHAGQNAALVGLPYTLVSVVAGWWGIPWGPIYTIETILRNLQGGIDVTPSGFVGQPPVDIPPGVPAEPTLCPEIAAIYDALPARERKRILRMAEASASGSLSVDPTRDFASERDASIELELSGANARLAEAARQAMENS
jgi:hypothetical protein